MINLRSVVNKKTTPENENPNKVTDTVKKILEFNKQQRSKGLKILNPKQILQRLPIALAQIKAGNKFENLLNEIRQVIYFLHWPNKIIKKLCNYIMNLVEL